MKQLVGVNPTKGRKTFVEDDPHTGDTVFTEEFDKGHALITRDRSQLLQSEGMGRGESMRLHCQIPPYAQIEMMEKYGIDCRNPDHLQGVFRVIQSDYPHFIVNKA